MWLVWMLAVIGAIVVGLFLVLVVIASIMAMANWWDENRSPNANELKRGMEMIRGRLSNVSIGCKQGSEVAGLDYLLVQVQKSGIKIDGGNF